MPIVRYGKGRNVLSESHDSERKKEPKVRSLSQRDPVPLGADPLIDADWVVVCINVRTDSPTCYVLEPDEVGKLVAISTVRTIG